MDATRNQYSNYKRMIATAEDDWETSSHRAFCSVLSGLLESLQVHS